MPDWDLNPSSDYDDVPTVAPSGCEAAERGESCGKTDCPDCGRKAAAQLRADALLGTAGVIALAREIIRIDDAWGVHAPDDVVTPGDLARLLDPCISSGANAWAEGICEALTGSVIPGFQYQTDVENVAHAAGVRLVERHSAERPATEWPSWLKHERRRKAAQTTAADIHRSPDPDMPWIDPGEFKPCTAEEKARRLGITSAAGALAPTSRPTVQPGQRAASESGLNSRAQHRGRSVR